MINEYMYIICQKMSTVNILFLVCVYNVGIYGVIYLFGIFMGIEMR